VEQISFKRGAVNVMTTTKTYDPLNLLLSVGSVPSGSSAVNFGYSHNYANHCTLRREADGGYWRYEYDALGQVTSGNKYWADGTPVAGQQFQYGFDDIGNRLSTKAGGDENGANFRTNVYYPNLLNQYTSRTVPGAADVIGVSLATNTVTVNSLVPYRKGEYFRKELTVANSSAPVWQSVAVAATGQTSVNGNTWVPRTPEAFGYDSDGNLTNDGRWAYTWDAENRLHTMVPNTAIGPQSKLAFDYDARGRRIRKQVWNNAAGNGSPTNDLRFVYDGWNLIGTLNSSLSLVNTYTWGLDVSGSLQGAGGVGGLLVASEILNGQIQNSYLPAFDGNGNLSTLVKAGDGTESARYEYGLFGEVIRMTGVMAKANPFRFSTKYQDDETDLLYYGYRYYSALMGRWLSRDPSEENGALNVYCFVNNDGIGAFDILGLTARTFPLYRLPYLKKPVLAYADVNVWRSSQGPILIKMRVWRNSDQQSRRDWNNFTAWPGMPQTWDAQHQWLWPNMASLLNARGPQRYGEPDPSRDNMDAAFFGAVAMPEGGTRPPLVSADWLNDNGVVDKQAVSHSAFLNPGFAISVSSQCSDPPPIGFWLVFPDGSRGGAPGGGWPREWDGTVYLYAKITWSGGEAQFDVPNGPPPASPMANLWETWKNSGATPRFIY